jgi:hypothetical protein
VDCNKKDKKGAAKKGRDKKEIDKSFTIEFCSLNDLSF